MKKILWTFCFLLMFNLGVAHAENYVWIGKTDIGTIYMDEDRIYVKTDAIFKKLVVDTYFRTDLNDYGRNLLGDRYNSAFYKASYIISKSEFNYGLECSGRRMITAYDDQGKILIYNDTLANLYWSDHFEQLYWAYYIEKHINYMWEHGAIVDKDLRYHY